MSDYTDLTTAERRRLPVAQQQTLLRKHLVAWIQFWCTQHGVPSRGFVRQLDQLCQLYRRKDHG